MTAQRSTKQNRQYSKHRKVNTSESCPFCNPADREIIDTGTYYTILRNIFPYSIWDGQEVQDHLMIVPKAHRETMTATTKNAAKENSELFAFIAAYESKGYNIYTRAPGSAIRSVPHHHTHLIKPGKHKRFVLMIRKPYIRISQ